MHCICGLGLMILMIPILSIALQMVLGRLLMKRIVLRTMQVQIPIQRLLLQIRFITEIISGELDFWSKL